MNLLAIKKQNSKFTPYWNYSIESCAKEAQKQWQNYLDVPLEQHIQERISLHKRFQTHLKSNIEPDIEHITRDVQEHAEAAEQNIKLTVAEYYDKYMQLKCGVTDESIPYDTDYFYIVHDESEGYYTVISLNGLKELQKQINEFIN